MAAMDLWQPRANRISRRGLFAALASAALPVADAAGPRKESTKPEVLPADWSRYVDPSTEFEVQRLTRPDYASYLPVPPGRAVSHRGDFVLLATARTGSPQLARLDLKSGQCHVLTQVDELNTGAFTLSADDRSAYFVEGSGIYSAATGSARLTPLWESSASLKDVASLACSDDGTALWFARNATGGALFRLRPAAKSEPVAVVRHDAPILEPEPNPRRALVAWRSPGGTAWLCEHDGANKRQLDTPSGAVLQLRWGADGQSVLYLHDPGVPGQPVCIREQDVDSRADRLVARTSQFASFARNVNATVFAGASRSKASPYALLMLRVTQRELTLCEHRARDAAASCIAFSPDSQRLVFQGDREGRMVVYSVKLERLIEKTDG
jgi:oligogalacturonide lyase